ncbi:hypothetical protein [Acidihalobacter aeolianus]|uniref:hypothetical protein n=1 Tax=Acidihalobacter aeolianus TaxID=2792603 RepID=UPI0012E9AD6D|nr:hypothetical protein [Acidihalobacter aeolianus]
MLDAKGQAHTVKIDASSGKVLAQGLESVQDAEGGDGEQGESADGDGQGVMNQ